MADIKTTMDISDIAAKSRQLETLLRTQAAAFADVNQAQVKFDAQGAVIGARMDSINSKGQKLITTIGKEYVTVIDSAGKATRVWLGGLKELYATIDYGGTKAQAAFNKLQPSPTLKDGLHDVLGIYHRLAAVAARFAEYKILNFGTNSIIDAVKAAREYQIQVSLIRTISQEAQLSTSQWTAGIADLSSKLGIEFKDVASAAYDAVSNQIAQGANTFQFLENAGNLARITGSTMKDSGNILANIINTFGSAAGTQEQVVAKLFTLQDRGRIVLSEIANTYGRVAFTAEAAGVSMDEVNGAIALMTRSGVTGDDAITLLNNVMTHFLKPSEAMRKHLDEIGIGASANVFKIKGFTGAIQVLADAVKAGVADTQQLFPDIRANRAFGFLQTRTGDLQNEINIQGSDSIGERTAAAIAIRAESSADKINKALISFQNTLTQAIGTGVNSLLQQGIEAISGQKLSGVVDDQVKLKKVIEDTVQTIMKWVKVGGQVAVTIGLWRTSLSALRIVTELSTFSAQKKLAIEELIRAKASQGIAITNAQAAAEVKLGRARAFASGGSIAALGGPAGIALVGASVLASYTAFKEVSTDAFNTAGSAMEEYRKKLDEAEIDKKFTKNADGAKVFAEVLQRISRETLKGLTTELQGSSQDLEKIKTSINDTGTIIKNKMVGYFDLVRNSIQRAEQEVTRLQSRLDGAAKFKGGLADRINDAVGKFQAQGADDVTGINLIEQRIKVQQGKIAALYARGDADSIQEARKLSEQIVDLVSERYSKIQDLNNKNQANADPSKLQGAGSFGLVDPGKLERELSGWQQQVTAMEDAAAAKDKNRIATLQLSIAEEKAAMARAEDAVKAFENFSIYDKGNNVKKEFQTSDKLDLEKARAGYQKVKDELNASLKGGVLEQIDKGGGLGLRESLQTQADQQLQLLGALEKHNALKKAQQEQVSANEVAIKSQDAVASSLKKWGEDVTNTTAKVEAMATALGKVNEGMGNLIGRGLNQKFGAGMLGGTWLGRGLGIGGANIEEITNTGETAKALKDEQEVKDQINAVLARIRESPKKTVTKFGKVVPDIAETRGIQQDLLVIQNTLAARASDLGQKLSGGGINKDVAVPLEAKLAELQRFIRDFESLQKDLDKLEADQAANEKLLTTSSNVEKIAIEMNNAKIAGDALFGGMGAGAKSSKTEIEKLEKAIMDLNKAASERAGFNLNTPIEGKAYGGPIGSDNQLIYAKQGESVLTQEATSSFYSQIMAMNAQARTPQHFSGGGAVGGPVTINVNESRTPGMTGRDIMQRLQRQQRMRK